MTDRASWHQPIPRANIVRENWRSLPLALLTPAEQALYRAEVAAEVTAHRQATAA